MTGKSIGIDRAARRLPRLAALAALASSPLATAQSLTVTAQPVARLAIVDAQSAPAEVVPANRTIVASEVTARIARIAVDVGASVDKGDLLVQLDDTDYVLALRQVEANIAALQAQIDQAQIQLQRTQSLAARQFASEDDVLERTTALTVLKRNIDVQRVAADIAKTNVKRTRVVAPFAGEIELRTAQEGAYATTGSPLLTITQTSGREISAELHPPFVAALATAPVAQFESAGQTYAAKVLRIAQVVNPDSRLQTVRLEFTGTAATVGTTGSLKWAGSGGLVPAHLVVQRDGRLGLFVVNGAQARFHVLPGASEGRAVAHDLAADALIIVEGRTRLQDGDAVSVRAP